MKRMMVVAVLAVATAVLGPPALAGVRQTSAARAAGQASLLARVNVTASEFKFVLSAKSARRGLVSFKVKNVGKLGHDFQSTGARRVCFRPGSRRPCG